MLEETARPQQRCLRFSNVEPVACERIDIEIELERVDADERNRAGWVGHIRWRLDDNGEDVLERLCRSLVDLCLPKRVWTDNRSAVESRRKGAGGDA